MSKMKPKVLIVEDITSIALVYKKWLCREGFDVSHVETGEAALDWLRKTPGALALLDIELPKINGFEVLQRAKEENLEATIVVVTSSGSISSAVSAMQKGAFDFIVKPASEDRLVTTLKNAVECERSRSSIDEIRRPYTKSSFHGFHGSSLEMVAVYKTIEAVAQSNATVFITGESGTGKELCADAIHRTSARRTKPFVAINCAAIPKDLIESEIFGHVRGAYTGATSERDGAAVAASGGTLFLDELCEMDFSLQSKLLRFLQTGSVQKVGSDKAYPVDVRIVCATNRDPLHEVREGRFREDLFYRLFVVPLELPPLRQRGQDIIELAKHFLTKYAKEEKKPFKSFSEDAEGVLLNYDWPGNIRELQNVVRNAVIMNNDTAVTPDMLILSRLTAASQPAEGGSVSCRTTAGSLTISLDQSFEAIERKVIESAIHFCGGSIPKAASMLELSPSTIYRKMEAWKKHSDTQQAIA